MTMMKTNPMCEPEVKIERANEHEITIYLKSGSCAELNRSDFIDEFDLQPPIFWFARIKSKVEGRGDGTLLMERVCHHADRLGASIVNEINPYGRMNLEELIDWFGKFSFKDVGHGVVVRRPKHGDDAQCEAVKQR